MSSTPKTASLRKSASASQRALVKDLGISWKEANDAVVASQKELGANASEESILAHAKDKAASAPASQKKSKARSSSRVSDKELAKSVSYKTAEKGEKRVSDSARKSSTKRKSFKGLRGLLRSKSSKKNKENTGPQSTDENSVVLDDRSTSGETAATESVSDVSKLSGAKDYLLRVVVLLMDVKTRRFELLQLEFDSEKAMVSDVLSQVPVSVTEETLRLQQYQGVVVYTGEEMLADKKLSGFCKGSDVLVAVPKEMESEEVARLSKPILSDPNVVDMLKSSGIDASNWSKESTGEGTEVEWKSRQIPAFGKADVKKFGNAMIVAAIGCVVIAVIVNFLHIYMSSPIQLGHVVSPGIVLSHCGLLKGWPIIGPSCSPAYLEVSAGMVSYYEGKTLAWVIHGHVCEKDEVKAKTCVDGLEFLPDGSLAVGSQPIKWLERHSEGTESQLTPWPFAEQPKIKSWRVAGLSHGAKEAVGKMKDSAADAANKVKDGATVAAGKIKNSTVDTVGKIQNVSATIAGGAADKIKLATDKLKEAPQMFRKSKEEAA
mmetsp:Transcript_7906/g.22020  ORF Transcript_7906/g.22020 Transcript_7906/m.22020 type:complete len:547 (+) Transcript_7906:210-1850(+)